MGERRPAFSRFIYGGRREAQGGASSIVMREGPHRFACGGAGRDDSLGSVQAFARALEQASQPNQLTPYSVAEPFLPPTPQPSLSTPPPVTSAPPAPRRRRGLSRGIAVLLLIATVLVIGAGILISSLTGSPSGH